MASKIFNLKRQVQDLRKAKIPCVDSVIRKKLEAKSGYLNLKLRRNTTASLQNATANHSSKSSPAVLKARDESKYSREGHKKAANPRPSAQPLVTRVMNVKLHHNKNYFMKSIDVKGATKSNIENAQSQDQFVVNQPVPQNSYYQSSNFQNYNNPYNLYWKKKM